MIQYEKLADGVYALSYKTNPVKLKYTKEQLLGFLENDNEEKLREASHYFFSISGHYRRLIQYYSNILTFDHLIVPRIKDKTLFANTRFENDFQKVLGYSDDSYIEETCRFITLVTLMDGAFYGYERQLGDIISIQQLPPKYCRSKYKINGVYAIEFNLKFFEIYKDTELKLKLFEMFPEEFLKLYLEYKDGKTKEWVQLDPKFARCHKLQDIARPMLADIFPELINLKEYMEMDKSQSKMDLYKLIVQKLPIDKETGEPTITLEEGKELHKNAKKMITQEGIDVLTTPLEVDSVNLQEKGSTLRDNIERANNNVYNAAGTSKIIFNSGSDGGSIGLSNSIITDESLMFPLLDQFKRWYDNKFKNMVKSKVYWFEILLPKITIFNRKEMFDLFKEAATLGYSKLMPLVAMGIKQTTFMNMLDYENDYLKLEERMKPLQSSHTQSGDGGRPEKNVKSLSDKGLETRNKDANKNRAK